MDTLNDHTELSNQYNFGTGATNSIQQTFDAVDLITVETGEDFIKVQQAKRKKLSFKRPRRSEIRESMGKESSVGEEKPNKSIDNLDISHVIKGKRRSEKTKDRSHFQPILCPIDLSVPDEMGRASKSKNTPRAKSRVETVSRYCLILEALQANLLCSQCLRQDHGTVAPAA